ncbi:MAG: hypothetical protein IJV44_01755 [Prevotella sp.]|nr:hypothetical protein [Prevotella sp.]
MKLKELFAKYTFDEILPYLKAIDPEKGDSMYQFREAYDLLRHMEPSMNDCGEVRLEWSSDKCIGTRYVMVHYLAGDYWEDNLAKEVVLSEDLQISEMKAAANCLWEITFYGFGQEEDEDDRNIFSYPIEEKNKYDTALYKLQLSNWKHTTPRRYRSKEHPLCIDAEYGMKRRNKHRNRSKRKRDYRVECREEFLKMHSQREDLIQKIVHSGAFRRDEVESLHQMKEGQYYPYRSRTWDITKRIDYILDSINKYQVVDFSRYDDAFICICSSSEHSVTEAEKERLLEGLPKSLRTLPIKIGLGTKEVMNQEVEMMLFLNIIRKDYND